ncbi:MAG: ribosome silencing factor [Gammaproteobacteria bacterium]|nr:ribosome silencing factor [Gammaproteobacteria bacterium]
MRTAQLRKYINDALEDAKAHDVINLDVRKVAEFTDYMIIVTGTSNRHVASVADKVLDKLTSRGRKPIGVEGMETGDWVLIDFGDVVVHVMRAPIREFYQLEKLWGEGKEL